MSDAEHISENSEAGVVDATRAEVQREFAGKLAQAELRFQAAKDGVELPDSFTEYLDSSKLLSDNGTPSAIKIDKALQPFRPKMEFPQLETMGHYRTPAEPVRSVSLDARHR